MDQRLRAVEAIVRDRVKRPIRVRRQQVERDVIVAHGGIARPGGVPPVNLYVCAGKRVGENGGGSGTPSSFLESLAGIVSRRIVDETDPNPNAGRVAWAWDLSATDAAKNPDSLEKLIADLEGQTGLRFRQEKRRVEVYSVVEDNAG